MAMACRHARLDEGLEQRIGCERDEPVKNNGGGESLDMVRITKVGYYPRGRQQNGTQDGTFERGMRRRIGSYRMANTQHLKHVGSSP